MKRTLLFSAIALTFSTAAQAVYVPPSGQPLYIKFDNIEQISQTNSIESPSGAAEGNWGVFEVSDISLGDLSSDPTFWGPISPPIWQNESTDGAEITGIFWGITNLSAVQCTAAGAGICGTGGFLDLYWDSTPDGQLTTATTAQRTADDQFTNFTDGTFLVRLAFDSGIVPTDSGIDIVGSQAPTNPTSFVSQADSYMSVDYSQVGPWTSLFDGDYFTTAFGQRDVRLRNIFNGPLPTTNGWTVDDTDLIGAQSSDPFRVFTSVPEPATLLLLGAGMAGLGFSSRRRRQT
jgi:hypothetical protein